jgi:non-ribosomal peptide synthetase component F
MQATPATWRLLLAAGWEGAPGFRVLCGGEALPADLADALAQRGTLFNLYGPTETTIWSTCHRVSPGGPVLIGHPLANQQVHVLDGLGQRVPLGVPGELYIGGDGVSRGYLNRPDLTAERFVPDPFRGVPGARMYRTGDVVRLRADGNLEFIGRNDGQVKVRGFRIELGEIEGALARHPAVAQAVAQVRELRAGDARLVAWYVGREGATASDDQLRQHLRGILPEYMVPQHLVRLDRLPLTPNGKIDRKALPTPEASTGPAEGFVAPRTPAEERVAALWQEALGVARVGVHDDFFALGGHSLLAAQVIARLAREHGIAVPMRRMFEAPTVAAFAALLGDSRQVDIPRVPEGPSPASFMQERVWNLDALQPGRAVFHLPAAFRLRGPLDVGALEGALRAFAARHDAVRTTLRQDGNDVVQRVAPEFRCSLAPEPVPGAPGPEQEAALRQVLLAASLEPFDLEQGPLLRLRLFRLAQEEHVLFALPHHAIWDGWSFDLLVRDLDELYAAAVAGRAPRLPDLTLRYRDFAAWHRGWLQSPEVQAQADWWRSQLAGAVEPLELPADRRRTRAAGDGGDTLWVEVSRAEADALGALGPRSGATLVQVMLAAFQVVLHRWSGQSDLLVGTPVRGRSLPGLDDLVGTFVNTLLVRTSLAGRPSFSELLRRVRAAVTDAFAHEDVPFELLTMTGKPVFRALFSFQDVRARPRRLGPLALEQVHVLPPVASNDVSLWVMEKDSGLVGGFNYSTALFDRATAEGLLDGLRAVLRAAIADPGAPVDRLPLADPAGGPILDGGPVTPSPLHAPFDTLAAEAPEAPAVGAAAGTALSRRALDARARGLAGALRRAGVGPGSRVALWLDDAAELAAALLATSRLGAAAAPLDQGEPAVRLEAQLEALRPAALVGGDDAPATACPRVDPAAAGEHPDDAPAAPVDPEATALIACLDGADEAPVLIELSHRAVGAAVEAVHRAGALGPGDVLAGPATPGPARRVLEVWLALRAGARLAPIDPTTLSDGAELGRALVDAGATALVAGADAWRALREAGFTAPAGFRGFLDGESVADDLAGQLAALPGGAFAVWGAAECAFWAAVHSLGAGSPTQPAPGLRLAVLAPDLRPLPPGVVGELAVAGASVARLAGGGAGPRLERDPGAPGTAWLITGDRARLRRGGGLELLGRLDGLAQIGGRRLSPARVEEAIRAHPGVAEAAVAALEVGRGERVLVAWWAARTGAELSDSELRRHLRRRLPRHAVPQHLVEVPALPRGADGSLDRAALRSPVRGRSRGAVALRTPEEALVAEIWGAALGIADLGAEDNFFDLGGHSLLALQVIEQLARRTGRRVSPMVLLDQSLSQVAERFAAAAS